MVVSHSIKFESGYKRYFRKNCTLIKAYNGSRILRTTKKLTLFS